MNQNCLGEIPATTPFNYNESNALKLFFIRNQFISIRDEVAEKLRTSRAVITFLRIFLVEEQNVP